MIWLLKPDHPKAMEFAPAMDDSTGILPGLPSVKGNPVHVAFDGGRMTSDAGILRVAAVEQRLGTAGRLADCIEDRFVRRGRIVLCSKLGLPLAFRRRRQWRIPTQPPVCIPRAPSCG